MLPPSSVGLGRVASAFVAVGLLGSLAAACGDDDAAENWVSVNTRPTVTVLDRDRTESSVDAPESTAPDSDSTQPAGDSSSPAEDSAATSSTSTSTSTSSTTTTTIDPADVEHAYPVDPEVHSSYTPEAHANYRATDIFASAGCGTALLAPVTGTVDEVTENIYDRAVDDPATRGGNAVAIIGDDGVRYYLAHFQMIDPAITPGARVEAGDVLGEMGDTGRAGACHVHFGLSLDCPDAESDWWIRRGVIWPDGYLDAWRSGENRSPLPALEEWFAEYPDACESVEDTPYPVS